MLVNDKILQDYLIQNTSFKLNNDLTNPRCIIPGTIYDAFLNDRYSILCLYLAIQVLVLQSFQNERPKIKFRRMHYSILIQKFSIKYFHSHIIIKC